MERKRHKKKNNHVVIMTTDAPAACVRQFRFRSWVPRVLLFILCVGLGALTGCFIFQAQISSYRVKQTILQKQAYEELEQENLNLVQNISDLETEIKGLENTIMVLSEAVNQKTQTADQLSAQIELLYTPTEFPLTDSATMEEIVEGDPMCIFTTSVGTMVVATAGGTVTAVTDDATYGHNVWIDHGNGYVTVYRNAGEVKVKQGEIVSKGATLFLIGEGSDKLGYQMLKDGIYINPVDMLAISG